ncbi:universal stress protein [Mycolicibacterium komossense]|uniref:Universal stress protein n=1 Tax=Mycolicibacterium komossense TaxID=1779 RepID=A0ABT3CJC9_9MYCO|nr:universal stress protein [Mycolicibacterium komossense]MCV7229598.1 universal stress protein [Mycolicibacterium komossense]
MNSTQSEAPIVVGIDGSQAAINAAVWAADFAVDRGVPLRLVHVVTVDEEDTDLDEDPSDLAADWPETEFGRTALRVASAAVHATGKLIAVDTEILWGETDAMLLTESASATMVCVGSVGVTPFCERTLGSTATTVAQQAHCPVAVIRLDNDLPTLESEWIVTVVDSSRAGNTVATWALEAACLLRAPVLALGVAPSEPCGIDGYELERRVASWRKQYPHLHIYPVACDDDVAGFLRDHDELAAQLAVIGDTHVKRAAQIVGPYRQSRDTHNWCSVLVVR